MIDYEKFKEELVAATDEADAKDGSGVDVHAELLEIIFQDIKDRWELPEEGLGEIAFVLKKIYGPWVEGIKLYLPSRSALR